MIIRRSKHRGKKTTTNSGDKPKDVHVTYDQFGSDETIYTESLSGTNYRGYNENVGIENSTGKRQITGAVNAWD